MCIVLENNVVGIHINYVTLSQSDIFEARLDKYRHTILKYKKINLKYNFFAHKNILRIFVTICFPIIYTFAVVVLNWDDTKSLKKKKMKSYYCRRLHYVIVTTVGTT